MQVTKHYFTLHWTISIRYVNILIIFPFSFFFKGLKKNPQNEFNPEESGPAVRFTLSSTISKIPVFGWILGIIEHKLQSEFRFQFFKQ